MKRLLSLMVLLPWIALSGSASCQFSSGGSETGTGGGGSVSASNGAALGGVAAFVVLGFGSCLNAWEECFPDEEKLAAARARQEVAKSLFTSGLPAFRRNEADGIVKVCKAAQLGFAPAQYLYATYLLSRTGMREGGAQQPYSGDFWLQAAAEQGHREAQILRQRYFSNPPASQLGASDFAAFESNDCKSVPTLTH